MAEPRLPRVLVIDDIFGRQLPGYPNQERVNLCTQYLLKDVTGDQRWNGPAPKILHPVAEAVFIRGQKPASAVAGDIVENDLEGTIDFIEKGWNLTDAKTPSWALLLLDLCFFTGKVTANSEQKLRGQPEGRPGDDDPKHYFGLQLLDEVRRRFPDLPVVILSSKPRVEVSHEYSEKGALDFLDRVALESADRFRQDLWYHGLFPDESGLNVGSSRGLLMALRDARRAAENRGNVLIRGERGTGKELLAAFVHRHSGNPERRPFVVVNSGALSPELYASELFGHVRGAFTGAVENRVGRILQAAGGDLFLDEIGNIPSDVQSGLLRVIDTKRVTPLGSRSEQEVDVRFIAATNEDIERKAASGAGFRADLLDRLRKGGTILVPSLRERKEDIPALAEHFVRQAEDANPRAVRRDITPEAIAVLMAHDWPGNVRELQTCITNAVNVYAGIEHLQAVHIRLEDSNVYTANQGGPPTAAQTTLPSIGQVESLEGLINELEKYSFEGMRSVDLKGLYTRLEKGFAHFKARYLRAAIETTRRPIDGKLQIHPAIKLATGDNSCSASKAADIVKRILKPIQPLADPVLKEALEIASRLRPGRRKVRPSNAKRS